MDWATQKKLKYFFAIIIIVLIGVAMAVFPILNRPATCFDKKQNGNENGIDCGGSCQFLCKSDIVPLNTVWARAVKNADKSVNLVAYIQNQNKTAGVISANYKFTIYDTEGNIIKIEEGETSVPANGNVAIFAGPVDVGERKVQVTTFEWISSLSFSSVTEDATQSVLETTSTELEKATTTTHLTANLRNLKRIEYNKVPVVVVLYDENENAVLVSRTLVDRISPEGTAIASFYWNIGIEEDITKIEVLPYFENFVENVN